MADSRCGAGGVVFQCPGPGEGRGIRCPPRFGTSSGLLRGDGVATARLPEGVSCYVRVYSRVEEGKETERHRVV